MALTYDNISDACCLQWASFYTADFILVNGRPDKNISDIRNVEKVYVNGEIVKG